MLQPALVLSALSFTLAIEVVSPTCVPGLNVRRRRGAQTARPCSASSRRRRCSHSPLKPAFEMSSKCQRQRLPSATFAGRTDGLRPLNNYEGCWLRGPRSPWVMRRTQEGILRSFLTVAPHYSH
jgi:hypothetical protein